MGRQYCDCANCGCDFHVDDEELLYCDVCENSVCNECIKIVDDKVVSCEKCDKIERDKKELESIYIQLDSLKKMCSSKHKVNTQLIIKNIKNYLEENIAIE